MKLNTLLLTAVMAAGFSSCGHKVMRGTVAMKTSDTEAHVCIGKGEVSVGDRVTLFRNVCVGKGGGLRNSDTAACEKREVGMGSIREILNEHYSVVKFDPGVPFEEGSFVEIK